ncbi:hypothetical protein Glove_293g11 [Diversispora epigaea]|uniref:Nucleolar complex-associated protein 3 n=1 Tax=Diversispora epigaea TaxID=1348612 RepID=A0A397I4S2_9GLOM|nr:hypothetical protein Glove_293g11 [Diversispora epigaea]
MASKKSLKASRVSKTKKASPKSHKSFKAKKSNNSPKSIKKTNANNNSKKNKKNETTKPIIDNNFNEDDIELSEEGIEFFKDNCQYAEFLKNINSVALHKKGTKEKINKLVKKETDKDSLPSLDSSSSDEGEEEDEEMEDDEKSIVMEDEDNNNEDEDNNNEDDNNNDDDDDDDDNEEDNNNNNNNEDDESIEIKNFILDSDEEQEYEKIPRWNKDWITQKFTKLPIKLPDGKIKQLKQNPNVIESSSSSESDKSGEEDESEGEKEESKELKTNSINNNNNENNSDQYIIQKKEELAETSQKITEDPENNIGQLKYLREFAKDENLTIKKLALLTQLVVYKDILPGYRIRILSDKEKDVQVSKEIKKIRHSEQSLLVNYQEYLRSLEAALKDKSCAEVALQCVCDLLTSVTHFNFRINLMMAIVQMMSINRFTKMSAMCCNAIIKVFKEDESGEASLDAVKLITKMIKSKKYNVHEEVLNTFLHLRLRDELDIKQKSNDENSNNKIKGIKRKRDKHEPIKHLTRKMKKLEKERKIIENEMKEAEAVVDKEEKEKTHTETLKLVFTTYFRILKYAKTSPLLLSVLEGLAKYAHLINVDFFNDLLEVLKKIMIRSSNTLVEDSNINNDDYNSPQRLDIKCSLLCIITAFQLLSGQGEALNIDLKDFYTHFYKILIQLALNSNMEKSEKERKRNNDKKNNDNNDDGEIKYKYNNSHSVTTEHQILMKGFDFMFFKRRTIPIERSAAFLKRLSISCLNWPNETVLSCLEKIEKMIQRQSKLEALLTSDDRAYNGIYRLELDDPELCNPFATSLWELNLLENHYDPKIRAAAHTLSTYKSQNLK